MAGCGGFYGRCDVRFGEGFALRFPYRFLPFFRAGRGQIGLNLTMIDLKLRKRLHLADGKGCGNRFQQTPPPGTNQIAHYGKPEKLTT